MMTHSLKETLYSTEVLITQYVLHHNSCEIEDVRWAVDAYRELLLDMTEFKKGRLMELNSKPRWQEIPASKLV